jgi:hypothetical protein
MEAGKKIAQDLGNAFSGKDFVDSVKNSASSLADKAKSAWNSSSLHKAVSSTPPETIYKYDEKAVAPKPKAAPAKAAHKMPSYKEGTARVPKTGPALLHKDEAVLPKHEAEHYRMAGAHDALGSKEHKPEKKIKHIVTKKAKNGGYIHEHHHTQPEHHPMEEHVSSDQDAMMDHMMQHMGEANPGEAEADAGQSGIPEGGAAGGM